MRHKQERMMKKRNNGRGEIVSPLYPLSSIINLLCLISSFRRICLLVAKQECVFSKVVKLGEIVTSPHYLQLFCNNVFVLIVVSYFTQSRILKCVVFYIK